MGMQVHLRCALHCTQKWHCWECIPRNPTLFSNMVALSHLPGHGIQATGVSKDSQPVSPGSLSLSWSRGGPGLRPQGS